MPPADALPKEFVMVLEVALIDVMPDSTEAFVASYAHAKRSLEGAAGIRSIRMTQGIETPARFVLLVEWDDVAAHQAFRASDAFGVWRGHLGPHFANAPHVEHFDDI